MATVLVTGGAGLVGHGLKRAVEQTPGEENWIWLSSKDGDLRKMEDVVALFEKYKPQKIVHLAARVGGLFANMADQVGFFEDNLNMNMNVVKCCHKYEVKDAIFCLSTCVFPAEIELPMKESDIHSGPPHFSNEGYAYSKRMLECQSRYYRDAYKYNWTCIIPTNIYGPHDNFHLENAHVMPALIHKCWIARENKQSLTVMGTGKPRRQFIYNLDLGNCILNMLRDMSKCPPSVIMCTDVEDEVSISDVVNSIVKNVKFEGEVKYDTSKADGIFQKTASNKTLRGLFPDFKFTPLDDGMKDTVEWFEANLDNFRK